MKVRVKGDRLVLVDKTRLPDGTVLDLVVDDEGDTLDAGERRALDRAISRAWKSATHGKVRPASSILRDLRKRR